MRSSAEKQQAESTASMWNAMHTQDVENLTSSWYFQGTNSSTSRRCRVGMHVHAVLRRCHYVEWMDPCDATNTRCNLDPPCADSTVWTNQLRKTDWVYGYSFLPISRLIVFSNVGQFFLPFFLPDQGREVVATRIPYYPPDLLGNFTQSGSVREGPSCCNPLSVVWLPVGGGDLAEESKVCM